MTTAKSTMIKYHLYLKKRARCAQLVKKGKLSSRALYAPLRKFGVK